tara:strand:+ start:9327 stop:11303 length:1977 start_codon:yes stop_codon:yes gene_type:complete
MAQLQDETVKKLNALLEKLAKGQGAAPAPAHGEPEAIEKYKKEVEELSKAIEDADKQLSSLFDGNTKHFERQSLEIRKSMAEIKLAMQEMEEGSPDFTQATNSLEDLSDQLEAVGAESSATENLSRLGQSMAGLGIESGGASEKLVNLGKSLSDVGVKGGSLTKVFGRGMMSMAIAGLLKPMEMLVNQTIDLMKAQDKAVSSFRQATGATAQYNYEITQTERRNFAAGVSAADTAQAFEGLLRSFSGFTQLNASQRAAIMDTTVNLEKLGVSAQTSGKLFDQAMRGAGMTAGEANNLVLDLAGTAQGLGVPMSKLADDFVGSFGELSKYGDGAIDVFKGLAVQAKNTGLEVNQLLQITKQFDTFEGAAMAVGKLNAIMGGPYLNSIDLLNASEEERIEILRRQVDMAGVQFDALNRFEQQAMASALNMSVEEANRLFRMSKEEYKLEALRQEELQAQAREVQEIGAQLKSAFMALAVDMRPLIDNVIVPMVTKFGQLAQFIGNSINKLKMFAKVGLMAAGIAAIVAAPFTGGMSLAAYASIVAGAGLAAGGLAAAFGGETTQEAAITPRFNEGGTIMTQHAALHPDEILITGGQGSEVISPKEFKELLDGIKKLAASTNGGGPNQVAVYIGQEKIDEIVVKAIGSEAGRRVLSPYSSV